MALAKYDSSFAYDQVLKRGIPGQVAKVVDAETGIPVEGIQDLNGNPIPALVSNSQGYLPPFQVENGPSVVQMQVGSVSYILANYLMVGDSAAAAQDAAVAAQQAADLVEAPADEVVKTLIEGTSTLTNAAVDSATGVMIGETGSAVQVAGDTRWLQRSAADAEFAGLVDPASSSETSAALKNAFIDRRGTRGTTRTLYVRATGNDSNPGTLAAPFREIRAAVDSLAADMPVLRGSVVIDVGAGTYKGGIRMPLARGNVQDDYFVIRGPAVGAHPNVPTAVIDHALDSSVNWGFLAEDGDTIWLENLKFVGGFPNAVRVERGVFMQWRNVHVDGQGVGTNGASIQHQCRYVVLGGIVENLTGVGILELFGCTRSFGTATSNATQMIIRNCNIGLQAKEAGVGHLDWLNVEDCGTGIQLNGYCVSNVKGVSLKRNTVGIANVNSEIHNSQSVVYGTGVDANGRGYVGIGANATDLSDIGWTGDIYAYDTKAGARSLTTLAASYTDATVTDTTTETTFYDLTSVIPMQRYNVTGRKVRIVAWGSVNAAVTTSTGYRLILRFGTSLIGEARVPQSAVVGDDFRVEFEVVCSADGNNQKVMSAINGWSPIPTNYAERTFNLTDQAGPVSVNLSGIPGATTESVTLRMIEVWG